MQEPNPYEPPQTESHSADPRHPRQPERNPSFGLHWILIPVLIGVLIGAVIVAPLFRGPGDPTGQSIGAGVCGFVGLVVGLFLRAMSAR
jgi:hypothetical protein